MAEPLNACSLAARVDACESGAGAPADGLHGQMGTVHIFDGVLKPGAAPRRPPLQPRAHPDRSHGGRPVVASASCAWAGAVHTTDVDGGEGTHAGQCRAGGRPRRGLPGPARGVSAGASPRGVSAGTRRAQARPRRCTSRGWSARPRWRARRRAARCRTPSPRRRRRRSRARWRAWRSGCCSATTRRRAQRAAARAHAPRASYRDA